MVQYRRKPYKRKPVYEQDQSTSVDRFDEADEHDLFDKINDDSLLLNDAQLLFDESDIVQQLRQEEREGKLPYPIYEDMEHFEQSDKKLVLTDAEPVIVKNYTEALSLARKALQDVKNRGKSFY